MARRLYETMEKGLCHILQSPTLFKNKYSDTRSSGPYRLFLLAPAEGIRGPFGLSLGGPSGPHHLQNKQMNEIIAFEVRPKKGKKIAKRTFFKKHFLSTWPLGG